MLKDMRSAIVRYGHHGVQINGTYRWEIAQRKDTQQTSLATSAVANDDELPRFKKRDRVSKMLATQVDRSRL
jgi:hypothetical protein